MLRNSCLYLLIIAIMVLLAVIPGCDESIDEADLYEQVLINHYSDINHFVLKQLKNHRIVLIGDFGHGIYLYRETIIDFLNYWLDTLETEIDLPSTIPRNLYLFLEMDSLKSQDIKESFNKATTYDFLTNENLFSSVFTTATLHFLYYDLKKIWQRVERYNNKHSEDEKIGFDIIGPEKPINTNNWSYVKRDSFFVYERDRYSSSQIIDILDRSPQYKALVFYGSSHLNRQKALKITPHFKEQEYYLAYYLSEHFDQKGGLYSFYIGYINKPDLKRYRFLSIPTKDYAIDNNFLDIDILTTDFRDTLNIKFYDGSIIYFRSPSRPRPLLWVKSEVIVRYLINNAHSYERSSNEFYRMFWHKTSRYLRLISGKDYNIVVKDSIYKPTTASEWKSWYQSGEIDIVEDIWTLKLWQRLIDRINSSSGKFINWFETLLAHSLGLPAEYDSTLDIRTRVDKYSEYINNYKDKIRVENFVHLLLVGSDKETVKALSMLEELTGERFETKGEWIEWWRSNQYK